MRPLYAQFPAREFQRYQFANDIAGLPMSLSIMC